MLMRKRGKWTETSETEELEDEVRQIERMKAGVRRWGRGLDYQGVRKKGPHDGREAEKIWWAEMRKGRDGMERGSDRRIKER